MTAEIICVGTELLLGNILNTNAAYLSRKLAECGVSMYSQSVVGDNEGRLEDALRQSISRSDIVLLSGGLGPTQDDLTKETAARVMGRKLVRDEKALQMLTAFFEKGHRKMTENNYKQADVPEGAIVLYNHNGTAPGIIIEGKEATVVLLPGPPGELIPMFEEYVEPYLKEKSDTILVSKMVKLCGVGESSAETQILDLIDAQTNPTIATYAKKGEVHLRITASASSEEEGYALIEPMAEELRKRFTYHIYTEDENVTLEESIYLLLKEKGYTLSSAESCTAGLFAGRFMNTSGVSGVYHEGYITYSNAAKHKLLGVSNDIFANYGAVSEQCAYSMAQGVCNATGSNCGIGITGIAGPDGGTDEKPVGLVYIGCCMNGKTTVKEFRFRGNRENIRTSSVAMALTMLYLELRKES